MRPILRSYQVDAVQAIKGTLIRQNNCLLVAPCGAGKTVCFCEVTRWLRENDRRVIVLLDREILVRQTASRIEDYIGEKVGIACASVSKRRELDYPVVVASRQTLSPMLGKIPDGVLKFNAAIIDEVHLYGEKGQYKKVLDRLKEEHPPLRVLGCTATPYRLEGGEIHGPEKLFDEVHHRIYQAELIEDNFLVPLHYKVRKDSLTEKLNAQLDRVKVEGRTGDLNEKQQAEILIQEAYVQGVVNSYLEHVGTKKKTAVYALSIEHAMLIHWSFEDRGIQSWVIHSKLKNKEVQQSLQEYMEAEAGVIVNVGILTIGSDIPAIESIILARRTLSTALFFQIVGRGARPHPGKKECLVLDLCGNVQIHGHDPDNPKVYWEDKGSGGEPKVKICPMCDSAVGNRTEVCPYCEFVFPQPEKLDEDQYTDETPELVDYKPVQNHIIECNSVTYWIHKKPGKPDSVRAEYYQGMKNVMTEWLFPGHPAWPGQKADQYWRKMGFGYPLPKSAQEWVARKPNAVGRLKLTIVQKLNKPFPEVRKIERITDPAGLPRPARSATA